MAAIARSELDTNSEAGLIKAILPIRQRSHTYGGAFAHLIC
jgi:hypothetical protein